MTGVFMTFEGPEGAGKTTLIRALSQVLAEELIVPLLLTREPGGNVIAEKIREIILDPAHQEMDARTEALLYVASRRQHLVDNVQPALARGEVVVCDRFVDSSIAYQGHARGIGVDNIQMINAFAIESCMPDVTFYIDIPVEEGLRRIYAKRKNEINRLDQEDVTFHEKVRKGYLDLVQTDDKRFVCLDGRQPIEELVEVCLRELRSRFPQVFKKEEKLV